MFCANLGAVLSSLPYWATTVFSNSTSKSLTGGGVAVDSAGNVITVGVDLLSTGGSTGAFITKLSGNGDKVWQRKIASTLLNPPTTVAVAFVATDSADNIIATVYEPMNLYIYVFKYDSAGTLLWQRRVPIVAGGEGHDWHAVAIDSADNIGIACLSSGMMTVLAISSAGSLIQQKAYGTLALTRDIKYTSTGNRIVAGKGVTYPALLSIDSTGAVVWGQTFSAGRSGRIEEVALDSAGNVYAVGGTLNAAGVLTQPMILKYSSAGVLQWQKIFTSTDSLTFRACAVDSAGLVYAVGYSSANPVYGILMCIDSTGASVWQTKVRYTISTPSVGAAPLTGISARTSGMLVLNGAQAYNNTPDNSQGVAQRLPSSSATVGTWGYLVYEPLALVASNLGYTATALAQAVTTPAITLTTSALANSVSAATVSKATISTYKYWFGAMFGGTGELSLYHTDVVVDSAKNVYFVGYIATAPSVAVYVTKINAAGQMVWQRRYLTGYAIDKGPRITINTAQDTLYVYLPDFTVSNLVIITYSVSGVLGMQKRIPYLSSAFNSSNLISLDAADNVYVYSQTSAAAPYTAITKLSSALALVYSKQFTTASRAEYGNVLSTSSGTYVSNMDVANNWTILSKISTDGTTVLWQRFVKDSANEYKIGSIQTYSSTYVYVGLYDINTGDRIAVGKYDASTGAAVWQRRITGLTSLQAGVCIAVDSADNCYVMSAFATATPVYTTVIAKFDSAGNQVWQRKLTQANAQQTLTAMRLIDDDTLILAGYAGNSYSNNQGLAIALKTNGSGIGNLGPLYQGSASTTGIAYAVSTYTVAAITPISTATTAIAFTGATPALTTPTSTSSTPAGYVAQLNEIV